MRRVRKTGILLLLIFLMLCTVHVSAADERLGQTVGGSLLTDKLYAEGIAFPVLREIFLASGTGSITVVGGRQVQLVGTTAAYQDVDKIKIILYLQRLEGDNWYTIDIYGPVTAKNAHYVDAAKTFSVEGGYYYRMSGGHVTIEDGKSEAITSETDGIWIY